MRLLFFPLSTTPGKKKRKTEEDEKWRLSPWEGEGREGRRHFCLRCERLSFSFSEKKVLREGNEKGSIVEILRGGRRRRRRRRRRKEEHPTSFLPTFPLLFIVKLLIFFFLGSSSSTVFLFISFLFEDLIHSFLRLPSLFWGSWLVRGAISSGHLSGKKGR